MRDGWDVAYSSEGRQAMKAPMAILSMNSAPFVDQPQTRVRTNKPGISVCVCVCVCVRATDSNCRHAISDSSTWRPFS